MLLPPTISRRPTALFCFFCVVLFSTCLVITTFSYPLRIVNPLSHFTTKETPAPESVTEESLLSDYAVNQSAGASRDDFIAIASQVEMPPFEPSAIQNMCPGSPWPKDLVFKCADAVGGLNNVRQQILTCVRFAIEFRAAIVFPAIKPRLETNASELVVHAYSGPRELDILFDREHFTDRLREGCPQMVVYDNVSSIGEPEQIKELKIQVETNLTRKELSAFRANWTLENKGEDGKIRLVKVKQMATIYEICNDGVDFANAFGQILSLRKDTHRLAAAVLYELSSRYSLSMDPQEPFTADSFLGIHLRTATDAVKYHFMGYEMQAAIYQRLALQYGLPAIYVASGNRSSTEIFAATLSPTPVVTKSSLLSGTNLELLKSLSWDQQAQIDYLVLSRASRFLGMSDSTFSWAVALARRAVGQKGTCGLLEKDESKVKAEKGVALRDELSVIIGKPSKYHFGTRSWP